MQLSVLENKEVRGNMGFIADRHIFYRAIIQKVHAYVVISVFRMMSI